MGPPCHSAANFSFSSSRLGAVALVALLIGAAPLAGCQGLGDVDRLDRLDPPAAADRRSGSARLRRRLGQALRRQSRREGRLDQLRPRAARADPLQRSGGGDAGGGGQGAARTSKCSAPTARRSPTTASSQQAKEVLASSYTPERPDWTIMSVQGSVADRLGDHEGAQKFYRDALKIAPGEPRVLSNLGLSYALTKQLPEAEAALRQALRQPARRRARAAESRAGAGARRQVRRGRSRSAGRT